MVQEMQCAIAFSQWTSLANAGFIGAVASATTPSLAHDLLLLPVSLRVHQLLRGIFFTADLNTFPAFN